jgi:hypothetical protein
MLNKLMAYILKIHTRLAHSPAGYSMIAGQRAEPTDTRNASFAQAVARKVGLRGSFRKLALTAGIARQLAKMGMAVPCSCAPNYLTVDFP